MRMILVFCSIALSILGCKQVKDSSVPVFPQEITTPNPSLFSAPCAESQFPILCKAELDIQTVKAHAEVPSIPTTPSVTVPVSTPPLVQEKSSEPNNSPPTMPVVNAVPPAMKEETVEESVKETEVPLQPQTDYSLPPPASQQNQSVPSVPENQIPEPQNTEAQKTILITGPSTDNSQTRNVPTKILAPSILSSPNAIESVDTSLTLYASAEERQLMVSKWCIDGTTFINKHFSDGLHIHERTYRNSEVAKHCAHFEDGTLSKRFVQFSIYLDAGELYGKVSYWKNDNLMTKILKENGQYPRKYIEKYDRYQHGFFVVEDTIPQMPHFDGFDIIYYWKTKERKLLIGNRIETDVAYSGE